MVLLPLVALGSLRYWPRSGDTVGSHTLGDAWHYDVSTISGIARNGERPVVGGLRG
jgi:hypothetical protein